jgi:hypothetical protein
MSISHARRPTPHERAAELESLERLARADERRVLAMGGLALFVSLAIGLASVMMSAHVTSESEGRLWFFGGLVVGNAGILATIAWVGTRLAANERP